MLPLHLYPSTIFAAVNGRTVADAEASTFPQHRSITPAPPWPLQSRSTSQPCQHRRRGALPAPHAYTQTYILLPSRLFLPIWRVAPLAEESSQSGQATERRHEGRSAAGKHWLQAQEPGYQEGSNSQEEFNHSHVAGHAQGVQPADTLPAESFATPQAVRGRADTSKTSVESGNFRHATSCCVGFV
jgi:hypothetical protein